MRRGFEAGRVRLVVFDVIGTTVDDGGAGSSVVADSYVAVFRAAPGDGVRCDGALRDR